MKKTPTFCSDLNIRKIHQYTIPASNKVKDSWLRMYPFDDLSLDKNLTPGHPDSWVKAQTGSVHRGDILWFCHGPLNSPC